MNAYSSDLRERIAQAYDEGTGSPRTLAARFRVSRTFVERLLRRRREASSLAAFAAVTPRDAKNWFRHCGYALR